MVMTDDNSVFLDTNILVYASVPESPLHLVAISLSKTTENNFNCVKIPPTVSI